MNNCIYRLVQEDIFNKESFVSFCAKKYRRKKCNLNNEISCKYSVIIARICNIEDKEESFIFIDNKGEICKI